MSQLLAPGYTVRAPRAADIDAVHGLIVASETEDFGDASGFSREELEDTWNSLDLDHDAWLMVAPDGSVAGFGHVNQRRHVRIDVEGYVHPGHFGRGIGGALIALAESWAHQQVPLARPQSRVVVNNWINARNPNACTLLEEHGYHPQRYFWRMETALDEPPPAPAWPDGVTVRSCHGEEDDRMFFVTMEEAMADHWGHVAISFDTWKQRHLRQSFDPGLWFLAESNGRSAGAAMCSVSDGIGWVDELGVLRDSRRRGLGLALLHHAAREFHRRGLSGLALSVDTESPTGATRLYERAGMHVARQFAVYGKELRPGKELIEDVDDA